MEEITGVRILKDLIAIRTENPPGNEKAAAVYLKKLLAPYGFRCEVQDLGAGRANFIAVLGRDKKPELMFNGHLDVVPAADGWDTDPFTFTVKGGVGYGRGVCDMKGGIAAMCEAAIRLAEKGGPKKGCLKLVFVADEEDANLGAKAYLQENGGGFAVIGEPTNLNVAVAHRGVSRDYIDITGAARHAALPEDGASAVELLPAAIGAVREINRGLKLRTHPILPPPGISITMVNAYEKDNVAPGKATIMTDFRLLPGMSRQEAAGILESGFERAGIAGIRVRNHFFMPGGEIPLSDPFVRLCCQAKGVAGRSPRAFEASCEQCFLAGFGIRAVILGPGSISQAHTANEFLDLEQLSGAARAYEDIADRVLR